MIIPQPKLKYLGRVGKLYVCTRIPQDCNLDCNACEFHTYRVLKVWLGSYGGRCFLIGQDDKKYFYYKVSGDKCWRESYVRGLYRNYIRLIKLIMKDRLDN